MPVLLANNRAYVAPLAEICKRRARTNLLPLPINPMKHCRRANPVESTRTCPNWRVWTGYQTATECRVFARPK